LWKPLAPLMKLGSRCVVVSTKVVCKRAQRKTSENNIEYLHIIIPFEDWEYNSLLLFPTFDRAGLSPIFLEQFPGLFQNEMVLSLECI
jgi:hypothetical protein